MNLMDDVGECEQVRMIAGIFVIHTLDFSEWNCWWVSFLFIIISSFF